MSILSAATFYRSRGWRSEFQATLALSWPIILTNVAQSALTTIDVMLTGRLGSQALAAGALGTNLYFACLIFGIGVVSATSPMIAHTLGRKRHSVRDVRRTFRQGLWAIVFLSLPIWMILWNSDQILILLGQSQQLATDASHYVHALQWAYLPSLIYVLLRSFVATLEKPGWALVVCLAALPINFIAAWCLMFGAFGFPEFGLQGAGYATLISSLFMAGSMLFIVVFHRQFRRYHLLGRWWRADWQRFFAIWRFGLPIGLTMTFEVIIFNISAFMMGIIGTTQLAAHAIALQIASLCFMIPLGIGQAASIRVGLAAGARDWPGVKFAGSVAVTITLCFSVCTALMMIFIPHVLISLFVDLTTPLNSDLVRFATTFLFCAAIFQFGDGVQAVGAGMLRGLRDARVPMVIAGIGYCVIGLPLGLGLAFLTPLRGTGIWIGLATALTLVAAAMMWRWSVRIKALSSDVVPVRVKKI